MDFETVEQLKYLIVGSTCTGVEHHDGFLSIKFSFMRLIVQSSWRLIDEGEIVVGSSSPQPETVVRLDGRMVDTISLVNHFNDLRISFTDSSVFETFAEAETFEHWTFHGDHGEMFVAGPGRLWSSFGAAK